MYPSADTQPSSPVTNRRPGENPGGCAQPAAEAGSVGSQYPRMTDGLLTTSRPRTPDRQCVPSASTAATATPERGVPTDRECRRPAGSRFVDTRGPASASP